MGLSSRARPGGSLRSLLRSHVLLGKLQREGSFSSVSNLHILRRFLEPLPTVLCTLLYRPRPPLSMQYGPKLHPELWLHSQTAQTAGQRVLTNWAFVASREYSPSGIAPPNTTAMERNQNSGRRHLQPASGPHVLTARTSQSRSTWCHIEAAANCTTRPKTLSYLPCMQKAAAPSIARCRSYNLRMDQAIDASHAYGQQQPHQTTTKTARMI